MWREEGESDQDLKLHAREKADWDNARTLRTALMVPSSEWVQSVLSSEFEVGGRRFIAPGRDYPYEGLMAHADGEHWRFIDCVAVSLQSPDGKWGTLVNDAEWPNVRVNPWYASYRYKYLIHMPDGMLHEVELCVSYRLDSRSPPGTTIGTVEIELSTSRGDEFPLVTISIQPFVDLRHMFHESDFGRYGIECHVGSHDENDVCYHDDVVRRIEISNHNRRLTFFLPPGKLERFDSPEFLTWTYKLGDGQRTEVRDSQSGRMGTRFRSETRDSAAYFRLQPHFFQHYAYTRLFFICGTDAAPSIVKVADLDRLHDESVVCDKKQREQIEGYVEGRVAPEYCNAVVGRIAGLTKFKTPLPLAGTDRSVPVPHAGAWWFRTSWFRDVFEGILSNFVTLSALPAERKMIRDVIELALAHQHPLSGLIPNRIPEYRGKEACFRGADATLLCFIAAGQYLEDTWDSEFAANVVSGAWKAINTFLRDGCEVHAEPDGLPRVDTRTGLLLTAPHHSWIDTRCKVVEYGGYTMAGLPNRLSSTFVRDLWEHIPEKETAKRSLLSPRFFLPEINAQWIVMLTRLVRLTDRLQSTATAVLEDGLDSMRIRLRSLLESAKASFCSTFWNPDCMFFYSVVYEDGRVSDAMECEAAVTAAAMLGDIGLVEHRQLEHIWHWAKRKLMVYRTPVCYDEQSRGTGRPFGLLVKNEDQRIFYNDNEYHADVVWPRSTPYLIRLLLLLGHESTARDLAVNALDHQMTEGVAFYNHELFSRPCGNNPTPDPVTCNNPVPVKNPIQFWSQWCDCIIALLNKGDTGQCLGNEEKSTSPQTWMATR